MPSYLLILKPSFQPNKVLTKKKLKLDFELELDFLLVAISCPLKDYRMCHLLNKHLTLELSKPFKHSEDEVPSSDDHIEIFHAKLKKVFFHPFFKYQTEYADYFLLNNKEEESYLAVELKEFDYFLMIKGYIEPKEFEAMILKINQIPEVNYVKEIKPDFLKNKENFLL